MQSRWESSNKVELSNSVGFGINQKSLSSLMRIVTNRFWVQCQTEKFCELCKAEENALSNFD